MLLQHLLKLLMPGGSSNCIPATTVCDCKSWLSDWEEVLGAFIGFSMVLLKVPELRHYSSWSSWHLLPPLFFRHAFVDLRDVQHLSIDILGDPAADLVLLWSSCVHSLCELGLIFSQPNLGCCWNILWGIMHHVLICYHHHSMAHAPVDDMFEVTCLAPCIVAICIGRPPKAVKGV